MITENIMKKLSISNEKKILLIVMDGVGDIEIDDVDTIGTPLAVANKPNINKLSRKSALGEGIPVDIGITPGSGPAHLSLFGYDPLKYDIGRGVLEAAGIGLKIKKGNVAIRGNFATIDDNRIVVDRRAGRISTEKNKELIGYLRGKIKNIEDVNVEFYAGKEHRCVIVLRGEELYDNINDTDPQKDGKKILRAKANDSKSAKTAEICNKLSDKIISVLKSFHPANALLMRGISNPPDLPSMNELFNLKSVCIATYPMYKGLAHIVGMDVINDLFTITEQIERLKENYDKYDFFYFHIKKTDSYGEDGNYGGKIQIIEEFDKYFMEITDMNFDLIVITGDHSTPWRMKGHSFHTTPIMFYSKYFLRFRDNLEFNENNCQKGSIGTIYSKDLMQLMLAHTLKLLKYGA